jgi:hypothetical protein
MYVGRYLSVFLALLYCFGLTLMGLLAVYVINPAVYVQKNKRRDVLSG